jgi:hypothetical protein
MTMPENDVLDEIANMSLLLLSWILECQDGPAPQEREAAAVERETFAAARTLSRRLLEQAERSGAQRLTVPAIQKKFASLISDGCRTDSGGGYSLEASRHKNCIVNVPIFHKCLIPAKFTVGLDGTVD